MLARPCYKYFCKGQDKICQDSIYTNYNCFFVIAYVREGNLKLSDRRRPWTFAAPEELQMYCQLLKLLCYYDCSQVII